MTEKPSQEPEPILPDVLVDLPATTDAFDGKGHQRTAEALKSAIQSLGTRDGAIGLEGEFGAGKSTVIRLAENALSGLTKGTMYRTFTFDLWAQQGAGFKRSLLEELLQWAEAEKFINANTCKSIREKIRDRKKTVRYKVTRRLTFLGGAFLLFAPLLPLVLTWLGPFGFSNAIQKVPAWGMLSVFQWVSLLFAALAYFAITISVLVNRAQEDVKSLGEAFSSTLSLFSKEHQNRTEEQNIRDEDPSSLEFQRRFREIVAAIQGDGPRLVLVFDNIDRLPAEEIIATWAETRSVFSVPDPNGSSPKTSVTAIVPYDRKQIADAIAQTRHPETRDPGSSPLEPQTQKQQSIPANELIAKTFDLTLRVSPPLSVDWRRYLEQLIDAAFGSNVGSEESWRLYKLFDRYVRQLSAYPTPRQIKAFVTALHVYWLQWKQEVPIESIALYVLHQSEIDRTPEALRLPNVINPGFTSVASQPKWREHLAALTFNVPVDKASQILLGPSIMNALEQGDVGALLKLKETEIFGDAFIETVEQFCHGDRGRGDPALIAHLAIAIEKLEIDGPQLVLAKQLIVQSVSEFEPERNQVAPSGYPTGIEKVVSYSTPSSNLNVARKLIEWASHPFLGREEATREHGRSWAEFLDRVAHSLRSSLSTEGVQSFIKSIAVPSGEEFSIGAILACSLADELEPSLLKTTTAKANIAAQLKSTVRGQPKNFAQLVELSPEFLTDEVALDCAKETLGEIQSKQLSPDAVKHHLEVLRILLAQSNLTEGTKEIAQPLTLDGSLYWHFHNAHKAGNASTAALAFYLQSEIVGNVELPQQQVAHPALGDLNPANTLSQKFFDDPAEFQDEIEALSGWIVKSKRVQRWIDRLEQKDCPAIVVHAVRHIISNDLPTSLNLRSVLLNYSKIIQCLGDEFREPALRVFQRWSSFVEEGFKGENPLDLEPQVLGDIEVFDIEPLFNVSRLVDDHIKSMNVVELRELATEKKPQRELLRQRLQSGLSLPANTARPALREMVSEIIQGDVDWSSETEIVDLIFNAMAPQSRDLLVRTVLSDLEKAAPTAQTVLSLIRVAPRLARNLPIETAATVSLDRFILPLIEGNVEDADNFLEESAQKIAACLNTADDLAVARIDEALIPVSDANAENADRCSRLRELFGLPKIVNNPDADQGEPAEG